MIRLHGPAMRGSRLSCGSRSGLVQEPGPTESSPAATTDSALDRRGQLLGGRVEKVVPGVLELAHALLLEDLEDVDRVDAERRDLVEDILRLLRETDDRAGVDPTVVGEGIH